uniref:Uncharacterized protein TCIL3000_8_3470 n=1 Tax=Trypanosoma congolense (strain IL3000) TaxID=1068625 RepID=G0URW6_TRYCI|nr:unnamed protein product [Trypanosoma congolense IL3000]
MTCVSNVGVPGAISPRRCSRRMKSNAGMVFSFLPLLLLALLAASATVGSAEAAVQYTLRSVEQLSLNQLVRVHFTADVGGGKSVLTTGDKFFFVEVDGKESCGGKIPPNAFNVSSVRPGGLSGTGSFTVKRKSFEVNKKYHMCYAGSDGAVSQAMRAGSGASDLIVWPSVYVGMVLQGENSPNEAGTLRLTLEEHTQEGRSVNKGVSETHGMFLLPCSDKGVCDDAGHAAELCAAAQRNMVKLSGLKGAGTDRISGTFTLHDLGTKTSFVICVPYCSTADGNCDEVTPNLMSYTTVVRDSSADEVAEVLSFAPPGSNTYITVPAKPQAREKGFLMLFGSGFSTSDKIVVAHVNGDCQSDLQLLNNLKLGTLTTTPGGQMSISFLAPDLIDEQIVGRVCYFNNSSGKWSEIQRAGDSSVSLEARFTIDVLQPSSYTFSPKEPAVGRKVSVSFKGEGLRGDKDSAFATMTTCEDSEGPDGTRFDCKMAHGSEPSCEVFVDPDSNSGGSLRMCYRKRGSLNAAEVRGTITMTARNPVFSIAPYPLVGGRRAKIQFHGANLSLADKVVFVSNGSECGMSVVESKFYANNVAEVTEGQIYSYDVIGSAKQCLRVCYFIRSLNVWSVARPEGDFAPVPGECGKNNLYVGAYALRFSLSDEKLSAKETTVLKLSTTGDEPMPSHMKIVRSSKECAFAFCMDNEIYTSACEMDQHADDYASTILEKEASILAGAADKQYILCAKSKGGNFTPVLPAGKEGEENVVINSEKERVKLASVSPDVWHVGEAFLNSTFKGEGLNKTSDKVLVFQEDSMLDPKAKVCPPFGSFPTPALKATIVQDGGAEDSVVAQFSGSHNMHDGAVVHFCFLWGAGKHVTHAGSLTFSSPQPSTVTISSTTPGAVRAGSPVTLEFYSNTSALELGSERVYFYRFPRTSSQIRECYCGMKCPQENLEEYEGVRLEGGANDSTTLWSNPRGFGNYGFRATYIICYASSLKGSVVYMGEVEVGMAQPTFYELGSKSGDIGSGHPFILRAIQQCTTSTCLKLSREDQVKLIAEERNCYDLHGGNDDGMTSNIGPVKVVENRYETRVVVNKEGKYRVCYGIDNSFTELPYTGSYITEPLTAGPADPSTFTTTPLQPSAGELLTLLLTCSSDVCSTCSNVWLLPGRATSCWGDTSDAIMSNRCVESVTTMTFRDVFLKAGEYSVCYGKTLFDGHRIPTVLTIGAANPTSFTASTYDIPANQYSPLVLDVEGVGLTTDDEIIIIPSRGVTCHSLPKDSQPRSGLLLQLEKAFSSTRKLEVDENGAKATWSLTALDYFDESLLSNDKLCDNPGKSCSLSLCYRRKEATWAPVSSEGGKMRLLPPNPSGVVFDRDSPSVGMYMMVTIAGEGLKASDAFSIRGSNCDGQPVTVSVGSPTEGSDGKEWIGVVRFNGTSEGSYVGCFVHGKIVTYVDVNSDGSNFTISEEALHYTHSNSDSGDRRIVTQYEVLSVSVKKGDGIVEPASMDLVVSDQECNYLPYLAATGKEPEFPVVAPMPNTSSVTFGGRVVVSASTYALCVNFSNSMHLVEKNPSGEPLTVLPATPVRYILSTKHSFVEQPFDMTFISTNHLEFSPKDSAQIIDGDLYDCGMDNVTIIGTLTVVPMEVREGHASVARGVTIPEKYVDKNLTVCYRRAGGTHATVPLEENLDRNLLPIEPFPSAWTTKPRQPQEGRTLKVTFLGGEKVRDSLSPSDKPKLLPITDEGEEPSCDQSGGITEGNIDMEGANAVWTIPAKAVEKGKYVVCYTLEALGVPLRVMKPPVLETFDKQSPMGVASPNGELSTVFDGERFVMSFITDVPLKPRLVHERTVSTAYDDVLLSESLDCSKAVGKEQAATIPDDFGYKDLVKNVKSAYLHLVLKGATAKYYVCMRRSNRTSEEAFYDFEVIGDILAPGSVQVTSAPVSAYTITPSSPRAWVPRNKVKLTYSDGHSAESFSLMFFMAVNGKSKDEGNGIISNCFRPTAEEATPGGDVQLLNTDIKVNITTGVMAVPFPAGGTYELCYQLAKPNQHAAPVYAEAAVVKDPSPTTYSVTEITPVGAKFNITFHATDPIFSAAELNNNDVKLFAIEGDAVQVGTKLECPSSNEKPVGVKSQVGEWVGLTDTSANWLTSFESKAHVFVCFRVSQESEYFPVPNADGGFIFPIGFNGARGYTVSPSPSYMGQELNITVVGSMLGAGDKIKIIDVTELPSDTADDEICYDKSYEADDSSAIEGEGAFDGHDVNVISPSQVWYTLRANKSGNFIVCYKNIAASNDWNQLVDPPSFSVRPPHPSGFMVSLTPLYTTQTALLSIVDDESLLGSLDSAKLVDRVGPSHTFLCTADAAGSSNVAVFHRVEAGSNASVATYRLCASKPATLTLCYTLQKGTWAEVPAKLSDNQQQYQAMEIAPQPFGEVQIEPSLPRPYEIFKLTFKTLEKDANAHFLKFAPAPQERCSSEVSYVEPLFYRKDEVSNSFSVALTRGGKYHVYIGTRETDATSVVEHEQQIELSGCNPCSYEPPFSFLGSVVNLTFTGNSIWVKGDKKIDLSLDDTIILVPYSAEIHETYPCDSTDGPFASKPIRASAISDDFSKTTFTLHVENNKTYLGEYYVCYKMANTESGYAIVPTGDTVDSSTFSIYPSLTLDMKTCPTAPPFLDSVTFTASYDGELYPKIAFTESDDLVLLPQVSKCGDTDASAVGGALHPTFNSSKRGEAKWTLTMPSGAKQESYILCIQARYFTEYVALHPNVVTVKAQDPTYVMTVPALSPSQKGPFTMYIHGRNLNKDDKAYFVRSTEVCSEHCGEQLEPTPLPGANAVQSFRNNTLVELSIESRPENVDVALCYRRRGERLVRLTSYLMHDVDPWGYVSSFEPRVGTQPTLMFRGSKLSSTDSMMIVEEGKSCEFHLAAVVGRFHSIGVGHHWTNFHLPLVGVTAGRYTVCYSLEGSGVFMQMRTPFVVQTGGPSEYTTSNTPMQGRATELTIGNTSYKPSVGDEVMIACSKCSCFDETSAVLPYGRSYLEILQAEGDVTLRMGMEVEGSYPVCYRIAGSGFAQVGAQSITPVPRWPDHSRTSPSPTYQGQRVTVTVEKGAKEEMGHVPTEGDDVALQGMMIVTEERSCWDTMEMNNTGVLSDCADSEREGLKENECKLHLPSVGPDVEALELVFPLKYTVCYREKGQKEYVAVLPPAGDSHVVEKADPSSISTYPESVSSGMLNVSMKFPNAASGDTAYLVKYDGDELTTSTPCDDKSANVTQPSSAFPFYSFDVPDNMGERSLVVCYTKKSATVAEVPQQLILQKPSPSKWALESSEGDVRFRQYFGILFTGVGLDPQEDSVVFSQVPCKLAASSSGAETPYQRVGDFVVVENSGEEVVLKVIVQLVDTVNAPSVHVCYRRGTSWISVAPVLSLKSPVPDVVEFTPPIEKARVGHQVHIVRKGQDDGSELSFAVITGDDSSSKSWCHNYTKEDVLEPYLRVVNRSVAEIPSWRTEGTVRLCLRSGGGPAKDVSLSPQGITSELLILGPNPVSFTTHPEVPRVGQQVTLTFQLEEAPEEGDLARIVTPDNKVGCAEAQPVEGFSDALAVKWTEGTSTDVILINSEDTWNYSSFMAPGRFAVCYYSAKEAQWSLVGGSAETSEFEVKNMAPASWKIMTGREPHPGETFALQFTDSGGNLNPSGDHVWAVPKSKACNVDRATCLECIDFVLDSGASTSNSTSTLPTASLIGGEFHICYQLAGATATMLPGTLTIKSNGVICAAEDRVTPGMEHSLMFLLDVDTDVGDETWRISSYDTDLSDCAKNYDPAFVEGRSGKPVKKNATSMTYKLEWPISMTKERYRICFSSGGVSQIVCPCSQFTPWKGDCYLSTNKAKVSANSGHHPVYVGQTLMLNFTVDEAAEGETISEVGLVEYVDGLTVCNDNENKVHFSFDKNHIASDGVSQSIVIDLQHTFSPVDLIVCVKVGDSTVFTRSGLGIGDALFDILKVRPYLKLEMFPTRGDLIRAGQTLSLVFKHSSNEVDDVVSSSDEVTFVQNPEDCREEKLDVINVMKNLSFDDCSFNSLPAVVSSQNDDTKSSGVSVTFQNSVPKGSWYVCYKLQHGTWAPVTPSISLLESAVEGCAPSIGMREVERQTRRRAMQYVRTSINVAQGADNTFKSGDAVRVIRKGEPCFADGNFVFSSSIQKKGNEVSTLTFSESTGRFKMCYRSGGVNSTTANWSPLCDAFEVGEATPVAKYSGCLRVGQAVDVSMMHSEEHTFAQGELFRFISADDECIRADGTLPYLKSITVGDVEQTAEGVKITVNGTNFAMPPVVVGGGITSLRLCYTDKDANLFRVPFNGNVEGASGLSVGPRLISSVGRRGEIIAGERVLLQFAVAPSGETNTPVLRPYKTELPVPYKYGPPYNGAFDAATGFLLKPSTQYREGRCFFNNQSGYGVYGNETHVTGAFDPEEAGMYVLCYRPAGCSVEDASELIRVYEPNPSKWSVTPASVRRGQLFMLRFQRNTGEVDSLPLSANDGYAVKSKDELCWDLPEDAGGPVVGTSDQTEARAIVPAEPPATPTPGEAEFHVCYRLNGHPWTQVTNEHLRIKAANPSSFTVRDRALRVMQRNSIQFHGSSLSSKDRVKVINMADFCTDDAVPPEGMLSYSAESGKPLPGSSSGWPVAAFGNDETIISISSDTVGTFSVCYRLSEDAAWTLVYGNLTFLPRIPSSVVQTPKTPAMGEMFTLDFIVTDDLLDQGDALSIHDQVKLFDGVVSCLNPGKEPDVIVTSPSHAGHLPHNISFQMASGTRGEQTLCYVRSGHVIWGFDSVFIRPNPWNFTTVPQETSPIRAGQLINIIFNGFGLVSGPDSKMDEVKVVPAGGSQTDKACQQETYDKAYYYPLTANGTHAVQIVRFPPQRKSSYWVCYKLNGGRFHIMPESQLDVLEADPFYAASSKGNTVMDGEAAVWNIQSSFPIPETAFVFYSSKLCNDFMYYEDPQVALEKFPHDVAFIKDSAALLRAGHPSVNETTLSLCYFADGTISMLGENSVNVVPGIPTSLNEPMIAIARNIFSFVLEVEPTEDDYVVLLENPEHCIGLTPPKDSSELFIDKKYSSGKFTVKTALDREGTYHVCYSHRTGKCGAVPVNECARTVGVVTAAAPDPSGWSMDPRTPYTTDLVQITLSRQNIEGFVTSPRAGGENTDERLWLAPLGAEASKMEHVAQACMETMNGGGIILQPSQFQRNRWTARLTEENSYGLCFLPEGMNLPAIFPPFERSGPVVRLSTVTNVNVITIPSVGAATIVLLEGKGLSKDDHVVAVGTRRKSSTSSICTNTSYKTRVNGTFPSKPGQGMHSMLVEFQFVSPGRYVICYKPAAPTGKMLLVTKNAIEVHPSLLTFHLISVPIVDEPLILELSGIGLSSSDKAAVVATANSKRKGTCAGGNFTKLFNVSASGSTARHSSIPKQAGEHVVCLLKNGSSAIQLSPSIIVRTQTEVIATFKVQPVCKASTRCTVQPVLALVDSTGASVSVPSATVVMRLKKENGLYADDLLSGRDRYEHTDDSTFQFLELEVSAPGVYTMEGHFTLSEQESVVAVSSKFTVNDDEVPSDNATVSCTPVGIIPRSILPNGQDNPNVNITCKITTIQGTQPKDYSVELSAGTSTEVTIDEDSDGAPVYSFTVLPPHSNHSVQFVNITVVFTKGSGSVIVTNSPLVVFIGSQPGPQSLLRCTSGSVGLPLSSMVRLKDSLVCNVQGRSVVNNQEQDICALPEYFHIAKRYDDVPNQDEIVDLSPFPDSMDGSYTLDVTVDRPSLSVSVLGSVFPSGNESANTPMEGSPARFTVIGEPGVGSTIVCESNQTKSRLWFSPSEHIVCSLTLEASGAPVIALAQELEVGIPQGGSINADDSNAWGSTLEYSGTTPAMPGLDSTSQNKLSTHFDITALYKPSNTPIASATGSLVFVSSITLAEEGVDSPRVIVVNGSGLSLKHMYGAKRSPDCQEGVDEVLTAKPSQSHPGAIEMQISSEEGIFYLCFAPDDQKEGWTSLANGTVDTSALGQMAWVDTWLALLIVGIVFLCIFLVLLVVLIWCLCKGARRRSKIVDTVYIRPRPNDRFTAASSQSPFIAPATPQPSVTEAKKQLQTARSHIEKRKPRQTRLTAQGYGMHGSSSVYPQKEDDKTATSTGTYVENRTKKTQMTSNNFHSIATNEIEMSEIKVLPAVLPPKPPLKERNKLYEESLSEGTISATKKISSPQITTGSYATRSTGQHLQQPTFSISQSYETTTNVNDSEEPKNTRSWVGPFEVVGYTSKPLVPPLKRQVETTKGEQKL